MTITHEKPLAGQSDRHFAASCEIAVFPVGRVRALRPAFRARNRIFPAGVFAVQNNRHLAGKREIAVFHRSGCRLDRTARNRFLCCIAAAERSFFLGTNLAFRLPAAQRLSGCTRVRWAKGHMVFFAAGTLSADTYSP